MATFDLGRVTPLYKGDYSASASYELNDVVLYNGNLYWHVQATATVGILPTDTTVWKLAFADEGVRAEIRGYADDAQASKSAAATSASQASASASNASASASQAASSAQAASTKASEASISAQTASSKASEASTSAQSAASSAQTATDKATLASQKAAAASESASLATSKASAAATSETNAAASATSAQEYDESAQASAVNAQTAQGLAETAQTAAETAQGLAEDARDDAQEIVDGINAKASQIDANTASIVTLEEDCYKPYAVDTASGAIASFADGADDIPLKSLVVNIDPVQSGSGDPSPTNVRPISGWTGVEVTVSSTTDAEDGDTYDITFPSEAGTVYGGTLDVTNGVLTVDMAIVDMGTLNWTYNSAKQRIVAQVNSAKPAGANVGLDGACSVYKVVNTGYQPAPDKSIVIGNNFISTLYAAMVVHDEDYTDAETFKTAVSGQMLVFPIKTPITYQLTPTEVTTLLGTNNIWADTGDSTVEYRADTKLYIDRVYVDYRPMLAPVESTYTATRNYTTGQLLIVGNTLYKVTANIANGGSITVGTNVTATTLSEVISALA